MQAVVSFGGVKPEQKEEAEKFGLVIHAWDEFLKLVGDFHFNFLHYFNIFHFYDDYSHIV